MYLPVFMLHKLTIHNYAIIEKLEIDFSGELNIITGETGAGKSIIIGALGLILGERADTSALVNKDKKCIIEGVFKAGTRKAVKDFLKRNDLDSDEELVLRREIGTNGKSRAFINDTPVQLMQLQQLSILLVDLHRQFDTLELGENDFQREVIDALSGNAALIDEYQVVFQKWQNTKKEWSDLKNQKQQFDKEADYNKFQYDELVSAGLKENELEEIDSELKMLSNAEGIKNALSKLYFELEENETPLVNQFKILAGQIHPYQSCHSGLPVLVQRLMSLQIELKDIAGEIEIIKEKVNYDPEKIEQLSERLSVGYKLLKKHGVKTTHDLLAIQKQLNGKIQAVLNIDEAILLKENQTRQLEDEALLLAKKISALRVKQLKPLEENVNKLLTQVGMPGAKLKVDIRVEKELSMGGSDTIEFLFDANKSGLYQPVRKVASGGELSRLMLCIKSLVARSIDLPTMIFDEIDTGISGEAARQVGVILKKLALQRQVICITHQPQIAGKAGAHFFVYKEMIGNTIKTNIRRLSKEERILAIAQMLSGERPTAAAMENAKEMVGS